MKKRLLLSLMALCLAVSGFALSQGEFVYTPQGRFQITGDNLNANNTFQTMDGWTAIGEGKTLADLFITNADGLSAGFNSVVSTETTTTNGEKVVVENMPNQDSQPVVTNQQQPIVNVYTTTAQMREPKQRNGIGLTGSSYLWCACLHHGLLDLILLCGFSVWCFRQSVCLENPKDLLSQVWLFQWLVYW